MSDSEIEKLWRDFWLNQDTLQDEKTGLLVVEFLHFPVGTDVVDEIWEWFGENHSKGLSYLTTQFEVR
ncbi:hypothetical protein A7M79_01015 [Acinetobacter baumannii]|uniref:hypothetical protein n=1 Tax=Acinetobacter baumannii TaxID=470 RepID=UPI0008DCFD7C|nr:hypothetical protein [Acinetobacter baumannii]OIH12098.1 hypothetical protein A7M79_01015 [Acinetobacter baumannii]